MGWEFHLFDTKLNLMILYHIHTGLSGSLRFLPVDPAELGRLRLAVAQGAGALTMCYHNLRRARSHEHTAFLCVDSFCWPLFTRSIMRHTALASPNSASIIS